MSVECHKYDLEPLSEELSNPRAWNELSEAERREDPFRENLLGPFESKTSAGQTYIFYFDLDLATNGSAPKPIYETRGRDVLSMKELHKWMQTVEREVEKVRREGAGITTRPDVGADEADDDDGVGRQASFGRQNSAGSIVRSASRVSTRSSLSRGMGRRATLPEHKRAMERQHRPERLPWFLVSSVTRVMQCAFAFTMVAGVFRETDVFKIDSQEENYEAEERRLSATGTRTAHFEAIEAQWPHGSFFRPVELSCIPKDEAVNGSTVFVGTPFALYQMHEVAGSSSMAFHELSHADFPSGTSTVVMCGNMDGPCLLGTPTPTGVLLRLWSRNWHSDDATEVMVKGLPWRSMSGAMVKCEDAGLSVPANGNSIEPKCLLLVGWSGGRNINVALMRYPFSTRGMHISPQLQLPLAPLEAACGVGAGLSAVCPSPDVVALHFEPHRGRLWVLMAGGEMRAWELLHGLPRYLGSLQPRWPVTMGSSFRPSAFCDRGDDRGLLVVGRIEGISGDAPFLFEAVDDLNLSNIPDDAKASSKAAVI